MAALEGWLAGRAEGKVIRWMVRQTHSTGLAAKVFGRARRSPFTGVGFCKPGARASSLLRCTANWYSARASGDDGAGRIGRLSTCPILFEVARSMEDQLRTGIE